MKISVITVTHNCARDVENCLASVAAQLYPDIEHVVIDGASTDGTVALLQAHRPQLAVCISEPDGGIYEAMNKGIACSTGEIVGFLNADDFYAHDQVLASVASCFKENPSLDACYADLMYVDQVSTLQIVRYWKSSPFVPGSFADGWMPPHPTFFVRGQLYERFGVFDLSYKIAADVELMMRLLERHQIRAKYIPEVMVKMRMGGTTNRSLSNIVKQNKEILRALKTHGLRTSVIRFIGHKLISRGLQFLKRPKCSL